MCYQATRGGESAATLGAQPMSLDEFRSLLHHEPQPIQPGEGGGAAAAGEGGGAAAAGGGAVLQLQERGALLQLQAGRRASTRA